MSSFRFKQFEVQNEKSALKVGTDAVLLGSAMTILPSDANMLDIGTGTGVIALMAAQRTQTAHIEAIDIDAPSAEEAAFNFAASPWSSRICARHTSLSDYVPTHSFDLIFSNPPYYDASLKNPDAREAAARHTDSLSYRDVFSFASAHSSRLSVILPSDNDKMALRLAAGFGLYPFRLVYVRSTERKKFSRLIAEFSLVRGEVQREELTLMNNEGGRSEDYTRLTQEFYL